MKIPNQLICRFEVGSLAGRDRSRKLTCFHSQQTLLGRKKKQLHSSEAKSLCSCWSALIRRLQTNDTALHEHCAAVAIATGHTQTKFEELMFEALNSLRLRCPSMKYAPLPWKMVFQILVFADRKNKLCGFLWSTYATTGYVSNWQVQVNMKNWLKKEPWKFALQRLKFSNIWRFICSKFA